MTHARLYTPEGDEKTCFGVDASEENHGCLVSADKPSWVHGSVAILAMKYSEDSSKGTNDQKAFLWYEEAETQQRLDEWRVEGSDGKAGRKKM